MKKQYLVTFVLNVNTDIDDPAEELKQMLGRMQSHGFIYSYSGRMDLESEEIIEIRQKKTNLLVFSGKAPLNPKHWVPRNK